MQTTRTPQPTMQNKAKRLKKEEQKHHSSFDNLPNELILLICQQVRLAELWDLVLVSKRFYHIVIKLLCKKTKCQKSGWSILDKDTWVCHHYGHTETTSCCKKNLCLGEHILIEETERGYAVGKHYSVCRTCWEKMKNEWKKIKNERVKKYTLVKYLGKKIVE